MMKGLWPLRGTYPVLYTDKAADVIVDTKTGKEYIRGARELFRVEEGNVPVPIEEAEPDRYKFYYPKDLGRGTGYSMGDMVREIMVSSAMRRK